MKISQLLSQITVTSLMFCALSSTAHLAAADANNCAPNNCNPQNDCCNLSWCNPAPQCGLGYNPSAHLQCGNHPCCGAMDNVSGRFDILYWRPCSDGLELGKAESFTSSSVGDDTVLTNESHAADLKFKFDTGFRFGLGYYCPCDCWDVSLNWTHFHAKANADGAGGTTTTAPYTQFVSDWERLAGNYPTDIEARWTLDMDLLDLEFAQKYYVNHCFILRPFFGLRAARIDQGYHVEAERVGDAVTANNFASNADSKSDFRGIGPRVGMDAQIRLGCGVSLFGGAAASLVFGTFDRHSSEAYSRPAPTIAGPFSEFNYDPHGGGPDRCTVTMADFAIGLMWEHCFECCGCMHPFSLAFAWEQHAFYDLNHFNFAAEGLTNAGAVNGIHDGKTGDLSMQGLTVSAVIGF